MITVLGLDPSSTKTGYAVMRSSTDLVDAGLLKPARDRDEYPQRVVEIGQDLIDVIAEHKPDWAVIEIPSGHIHGRMAHRQFNGAGLSIYGVAVGYLLRICMERLPAARVECIEDTVWTGQQPKHKRKSEIDSLFSSYNSALDKGADAADAIGLLLYWWSVRKWQGC